MKASEVLETYSAFKELGEKELSFEAALAVAENLEALRVPAEVAAKKRAEITEKYLERNEDGTPVKAGEDTYRLKDAEAYAKELTELLEKDVEACEVRPIPKSGLSGIAIQPAKLAPICRYLV